MGSSAIENHVTRVIDIVVFIKIIVCLVWEFYEHHVSSDKRHVGIRVVNRKFIGGRTSRRTVVLEDLFTLVQVRKFDETETIGWLNASARSSRQDYDQGKR